MAQALVTRQSPLNKAEVSPEIFTTRRLWEETSDVTPGEIPTSRSIFHRRMAFGVAAGILVLLLLAGLSLRFGWFTSNSASLPQTASQTTPHAAAQQSPSELKEMQTRDDYAANLSKALHLRMPAYKNVTIYADNWTGNHAPARVPITDIKARTGDNLMLVFWSPEPGTAKGLSDFVRSRAAQDAVTSGFAEFQFIDPRTYCISLVAPLKGPGVVTCGIR